MKKTLPKFASKEEAALFWENHEVLDYIDANEFKIVKPVKAGPYHFINPTPKQAPKKLISLRVNSDLVNKAKNIAAKKKVGYQIILREWLEKGTPA